MVAGVVAALVGGCSRSEGAAPESSPETTSAAVATPAPVPRPSAGNIDLHVHAERGVALREELASLARAHGRNCPRLAVELRRVADANHDYFALNDEIFADRERGARLDEIADEFRDRVEAAMRDLEAATPCLEHPGVSAAFDAMPL